jgi:hypothetical protein
VSSFCLDRNLDHMFELLHTVLSAPRFEDVERLKSIIYGNTSDMQESLVESGHSYARSLAASVFSRASVRLYQPLLTRPTTRHDATHVFYHRPYTRRGRASPRSR